MKHLILRAAAFAMSATGAIAIPATMAHAQTKILLSGTYANDDSSIAWVFTGSTGQFRQIKSINGNPGTVVTDFTYEITNDGKTFNYIQKEIRLENHPMGNRSQKLNKPSTEQILIRGNQFIIGGRTYTKK